MARIRNKELSRLAADVLPERSVLSAIPGATLAGLPVAAGQPAAGGPTTGGLTQGGGLTQSLPLLGGGATPSSGAAGGAPTDVASQALSYLFVFGSGAAAATPVAG